MHGMKLVPDRMRLSLSLMVIACACIAVMTVFLWFTFEQYDHSRWMIIPVWFLFAAVQVLYLHSLVEGAHNQKLAALNQNRLESLLRISQIKRNLCRNCSIMPLRRPLS